MKPRTVFNKGENSISSTDRFLFPNIANSNCSSKRPRNNRKVSKIFIMKFNLIFRYCPDSFLGPFLKGKIDSWESFQLQLTSKVKKQGSKPTYPTLLALRNSLREMTRKKISPEEKMQIFRDTLDSYYVKNENEGFEYPDMEGDDLFFRGSEGEISK